jgi:tetratricopeptide (TPR) repeat protein
LDIAEDIGEGRGRAYALASAAGVVAAMGRLDEARSAYEEALQIHLAENDHEGAGNDLLGLGTVAEARGAIDDARAYFRDAVGRYEHISERPHIVRALTRLAAVAAEDEAMRAAAHAVAMIDAIKHDNVPGPLIDGFVEANRDAYRHAVRDGSR